MMDSIDAEINRLAEVCSTTEKNEHTAAERNFYDYIANQLMKIMEGASRDSAESRVLKEDIMNMGLRVSNTKLGVDENAFYRNLVFALTRARTNVRAGGADVPDEPVQRVIGQARVGAKSFYAGGVRVLSPRRKRRPGKRV